MSGGSYNYLCFNTYELEHRSTELQDMERRLTASGYYAAARATRNVILFLECAHRAAQALEDVWHAVEWADSCDYSEEQVVKAVKKFSPWPPEPNAPEGGKAAPS